MPQEITLQYNLCNEPWLKYTMTAVSDRGLKPSQWASARLHSEVLYLETHRQRYELSRVDTSASSGPDANSVSPLPETLCLRRKLRSPTEAAVSCCLRVPFIAAEIKIVVSEDRDGSASLRSGAVCMPGVYETVELTVSCVRSRERHIGGPSARSPCHWWRCGMWAFPFPPSMWRSCTPASLGRTSRYPH